MSNLKRAVIIELLWTRSRHYGGFGAVSPPNKTSSPPNWNMKYYKSVKFLSIFRISSPAAQTYDPSIENILDRPLKRLWEHSELQTASYVAWF